MHRALKRLLASEAPSEAGQAGDQIAARGGILASAMEEGDDEAEHEPVVPTEALLLTRFASKPLDQKQAAEKSGAGDEEENSLSEAEKAAVKKYESRLIVFEPSAMYVIDRVNNGLCRIQSTLRNVCILHMYTPALHGRDSIW